uniref:Uncharacterized protein n=1 Tax=Oryza meridionalis TaxID=40149 RepID=A0A0E0DRG2_9ORYZ
MADSTHNIWHQMVEVGDGMATVDMTEWRETTRSGSPSADGEEGEVAAARRRREPEAAAYFTAGLTALFACLAALLVLLPLVLPPLPPPPSLLLLVPVGLMAVLLALAFLPADGRRSSIASSCV